MTLSPGTRLVRYEICSMIGAGGMGDVYLERNTQLDRSIALEILPVEVATKSGSQALLGKCKPKLD